MTVERYIDGWTTTGSLARSPGAWLPLALLAAFKAVLLIGIYFFWHPSIAGFMTPVLESVFGTEAVHFPHHALLLGSMYARVDLVVTIALGFPLIGYSVLRMVRLLRREPASDGGRVVGVLRLLPGLFVLLGLFALVSKGVPILVSALGATIASPKLRLLVDILGLGASLTARATLLYGPVYLVLERPGSLGAIGKSVRLASERDWLTGLIVVTGWLIQAPLGYLISKSGRFLASVGGDFVFAVVLLSVFLEAAALFYMFASATSVVVESAHDHANRH